jgi:hypothetical protein
MARKKKTPAAAAAEVDTIRHKEKRKNIPTEELRDFVASEEGQPPKILYPRDPSLDPQLVWKSKDQQDRQPLAVDVVPIYIQEFTPPNSLPPKDTSSEPSRCTSRCTNEGKTEQADPLASLAAALLGLSPADRTRLAAMLLGQQSGQAEG